MPWPGLPHGSDLHSSVEVARHVLLLKYRHGLSGAPCSGRARTVGTSVHARPFMGGFPLHASIVAFYKGFFPLEPTHPLG